MPITRLRVLLEPRHGATYQQVRAMGRAAEAAGFDAFFLSDHYLGIERDNPRLVPTDSWTTLGGLARDTERVRLGTLVTPVTFRLPGVLAVAVATVDDMSGGRVELGMGAGWYAQEHEQFGIPFPAVGERFDRFEEQLAIITGMWTTAPGEAFSHEGRHYRVDSCRNHPRPVQSPRPPLIVGGAGPRRTPTLAARFADEYNAGFGPGLQERFDRFRDRCAAIGRDPATARLSVCLPVCCGTDAQEVQRRADAIGNPNLVGAAVRGGPDAVVERLAELADQGADTVYFHLFDAEDVDHVRLLGAEVAPKALSPV